MAGFGDAEAMFVTEFLKVEAGEGNESAVVVEEALADFDGAHSRGSGAEEDGEEFGIGEGGGSEAKHFFARSFLVGQVMNAVMCLHVGVGLFFLGGVASSGIENAAIL